MSWFKDDSILTDERPQQTVADGVLLERRSLLRLSAATLAAGVAASCAGVSQNRSTRSAELTAAREQPRSSGTLGLAEFMTEMSPRARSFIASGGQREEAYLMGVGELMARLETPTQAQAMDTTRSHIEGRRAAETPIDFVVLMFSLEPGKGFSHHDHRDYNGVILGVEGEAHVTNYDILGDNPVPAEGELFQIRQTRDDLILPGRFSSLGTSRDNIHELIAGPDGATVIDVFTFMVEGAKSYNMNVDAQPRDAERKIYEATWA